MFTNWKHKSNYILIAMIAGAAIFRVNFFSRVCPTPFAMHHGRMMRHKKSFYVYPSDSITGNPSEYI